MKRPCVLVSAIVLQLASAVASVSAQAPSLSVMGENGVSKILTVADLSAMPQIEVRSKEEDGSTVLYRGPTVRDVMTLVGAPTGRDGPLRIAVAGEVHRARWIRNLTGLRLVRVTAGS